MSSALHPAGDLRKISKTINSCHSVWQVRQSICRLKRTLHNPSGQLERVVLFGKTQQAVLSHPLRAILVILNIWILSRTSISICLKIYAAFSYTKLKFDPSFLICNKILQSLRPILHLSQKAELFFSNAVQRYFVQQKAPDEFVFNIVFTFGKTKILSFYKIREKIYNHYQLSQSLFKIAVI